MLRRQAASALASALASAPLIAGLLIASCGFAGAAQPHAFLELFTSQGCSSCPAADKLLGQLAADPSLVVVSLPIDYWDYLGWKDTLASPLDSARQRAYARARGDREVYTPQVVVNGSMHALGSDRAAIERVIAQTDGNADIMSVPVRLSVAGGDLNVTVEPGENTRLDGEVWLCPLERAVKVTIGRGENSGRTITYHNVVRGWLKLGAFNGTQATFNVPTSKILTGDIDGAAVLVQEGTRDKPGIVLGAAMVPIARQLSDVERPPSDDR